VSVVSESTDDSVPTTVDGEPFSVIVLEVRPISVGARLTSLTEIWNALVNVFCPSDTPRFTFKDVVVSKDMVELATRS
jgi:hypothetical protein